MKFLLKVMLAPVLVFLAVLIWLCGLTLKLSAWVFGTIGALLGILGLAILLLDNLINGIIVLLIAFYGHHKAVDAAKPRTVCRRKQNNPS